MLDSEFLPEVMCVISGFIGFSLASKLLRRHQSNDKTSNLTLRRRSTRCISLTNLRIFAGIF